MTKAIPVFVNRNGGTAAARGDGLREELTAAFAAVGLTIDLQLLDGARIGDAVRDAKAETVVVGGGDGTLGSAATILADREGAALGILPLGTRNHLARALGIPMDLEGAVAAIAAARRRRIDLGAVNGRVFVNNASIGFYPDLVVARDDLPLPKWLAALPATVGALKRMRHHRLRLRLAHHEQAVVTPMLFVGNNRYDLAAGRLGQRASLEDGLLSVYAVASRQRLALIGFALRTLVGRADPDRDFAVLGDAPAFSVEGGSRAVRIALDGEVTRLALPLEFAIRPRALTVIAPLEQEAPSA